MNLGPSSSKRSPKKFYEETENRNCISLKFSKSLYSITYIHTYVRAYVQTNK